MAMGEVMGMNMGDNSTSSASGGAAGQGMTMTGFHAGGGDVVWLAHFAPTTAPAILGTCALLFFMGLLSRWLHAIERGLVAYWHDEAFRRAEKRRGSSSTATANLAYDARRAPPWEASCDVPRGLFQLLQSGILYLLMLAVMTMNAYYFVAVLIGLATGESAFGRFGRKRWTSVAVPSHTSANGTYGSTREQVEKTD
ncbi:hypothetical protein K437DRAFT_247046 [Tilletiaria anomala UBC 951]|uniref:Copper transport protein n=1 Tax=Tilletiaria anomala (strain ATCC 24038 / CBS 436.72 / UBC 951) TaxID=1037660 RepID=A0A066W480_TILAU|nr:uncharacterized protein K437DRAFT_247046 [Tilletiaria anomala UBC 951]KDN45600.1 hypothetical protein K437DRAFT_247046 [Tilletiaria anomala UBC 951]